MTKLFHKQGIQYSVKYKRLPWESLIFTTSLNIPNAPHNTNNPINTPQGIKARYWHLPWGRKLFTSLNGGKSTDTVPVGTGNKGKRGSESGGEDGGEGNGSGSGDKGSVLARVHVFVTVNLNITKLLEEGSIVLQDQHTRSTVRH